MSKRLKKLYSFLSNITGTTKLNQCKCQPNEQLANEFAEFFIGKINKIRNDLDNRDKYTPYSKSVVPLLMEFDPLQEIEVNKIVKSMTTKWHFLLLVFKFFFYCLIVTFYWLSKVSG